MNIHDALALHQAGHLDQAKNAYLKLLEEQPDNVDALQLLAAISLQTKHYQRVLDLTDQVFELNPVHTQAHFNRGVALAGLKRYTEAIRHLKMAVNNGMVTADAFYNVAQCHQHIDPLATSDRLLLTTYLR